jgi:hypothetical protein
LTAEAAVTKVGGMPHQVQITINGLRLNDGWVEFDAALDPPLAASARAELVVVDGDGHDVYRTQMDELPIGDDGRLSGLSMVVPGDQLQNGEHVAWVRVIVIGSDHVDYAESEYEGVSCLVHSGRVYASTEAPPELPTETTAVQLENPRLEGDWVVCDIVNSAAHDVQCNHEMRVNGESGRVAEEQGEERVGGGARQQIHYLLPQGLADGDYWIDLEARVAGDISDYGGGVTMLHIDVRDGIVTVIP